MAQVISKDGTRIAFDKIGHGPAIIIVNGAMGFREFYGDKPLANLLSEDFTVYLYDRRGRGESTDHTPYEVEKEIEDLEALINDAGGSSFVYGVSSGAALALLAAAKLGSAKVSRLALYEPPYGSDSDQAKTDFEAQKKKVNELIQGGKRGDAAAFFISSLGTPPEALEELRQTSEWVYMQNVEHTLAYDYAILGDGAIPVETAKSITIPTLVMNGEMSFDFMHNAAKNLNKIIPNAQWQMLNGQTHEVSAEAVAPILKAFFS